jgi:hypothetical protein
VNRQTANRVIELFVNRSQLDRVLSADDAAVRACLDRALQRLKAAEVLRDVELLESAFTNAYDAYRTAADALVLMLGYRVPAAPGGHRIATDIAHAALQASTVACAPASAERFRQGRHESEYFDPDRPVEKTVADTTWALGLAHDAVGAVTASLSAS